MEASASTRVRAVSGVDAPLAAAEVRYAALFQRIGKRLSNAARRTQLLYDEDSSLGESGAFANQSLREGGAELAAAFARDFNQIVSEEGAQEEIDAAGRTVGDVERDQQRSVRIKEEEHSQRSRASTDESREETSSAPVSAGRAAAAIRRKKGMGPQTAQAKYGLTDKKDNPLDVRF